MCIAQGTADGATAASNRHGTYELWSLGPGLVSHMPRAFGDGHGVSMIPHKKRGSWLLYCQLLALSGHRQGHNTTGRRLLQTYLVRVQDGLQGPGRFGRWPGPSVEGTGCRSPTRDGVIGPHFVFLTLWVYRPGHKRRGGGCFKPTWYVRRVVPRVGAGVPFASGLRRRVRVVDPALEAG